MTPESQGVTQLLVDWSNGDQAALDKLLPLVNAELRQLARRYMRRENPGHTLQTSALINEAYIRLIELNRMAWQSRAHFSSMAARVMRRILVNAALSRGYQKRAGGQRVTLDEGLAISSELPPDLVALDEALRKLAITEQRKAQVVELRFFGGLSVEETAEALRVSEVTVMRDWRFAKLWLLREMSRR